MLLLCSNVIVLANLLAFQEPNLTQSRLALLIDSLASGADVFKGKGTLPDGELDIDEMSVVLGTS